MIAAAWVNRRRDPLIFAGTCIFVIGVLPVLGFVGFNFQYFSTVADRYVYLSMFGIALIAADILERLPRGCRIAAVIPLAILAVRSALQVPCWHDSLTLFGHVLDNDPQSAVACASVAAELGAQRDYERSVEIARRSIALDPHRGEAYATLGKSLARLGRTPQAVQAFRDGFAADNAITASLNEFTTALLRQKDLRQALAFARLAVELVPSARSHLNLGIALAQEGNWPEARTELETAAALDSSDYTAQYNLGSALLHLGDRAGAMIHFRMAEAIDPDRGAAQDAIQRMKTRTALPTTTKP